jgi:7-carboxy-7-deazaguanine synthase
MSIEEVVAAVDRFRCPLVEVTGGEPLLQAGVYSLMRRLLDAGLEVLLETGGHRDISAVDPRVTRIMDLKAPGSGEAEKNLWRNLDHLTARDEVKVVIADRRDYVWARDVVRSRGLTAKLAVLFSPVHGELPLSDLAAWILEDRLPVRLQTQLHKLVWGAEARGV